MPRKEDDNRVPRTPDAGSTLPWIEGVSRPWTIGRVDLPDVPNGALADVARFVDDVEEVTAEHKALDWDTLSASFPHRPDVTYARPTLSEYIDMCKAGAVQLHAVRYLAKGELKIAAIEGMTQGEYDEFIRGRKVTKEQLLDGLRARQKNEETALTHDFFARVPVVDTESMQKRGIAGGRAFLTVPATRFTELKTARAIFASSELQVKGNYMLPLEGNHYVRTPLLKPIDEILIPRQPQPSNA